MIFIGLIFTAFLIFLGLRIAQRAKRRRAAYKGEEGKSVTADTTQLLHTERAAKAQMQPPMEQTIRSPLKLVSEKTEQQEESGLERINRLPELQKAVVWAELLGKPRSEKEPLF